MFYFRNKITIIKMDSSKPVLYSYFRSSSSWRVRIALSLKGIDYEYKAINLLKNEQQSPDYLKLNPKGEIPCLLIDGNYLTQSLAIIEYLEETRLTTKMLYPKDPIKRAQARAIAEIINSGMQPFQNVSVLQKIGEEKKQEWLEHFLTKGLHAIEEILKHTAGKYCVGDEISIADICLVPQVYGANRFKISLEKFPHITRINAYLESLEEFKKAHPSQQPDCPDDLK